MMRILVQKFGGTSLSTETSREAVVNKIKNAKCQYDGVVVVVSAMGRKGDAYATDTLLSLIDDQSTRVTNREIDLLISCGEIISTVFMSNLLMKEGFLTCALTGGAAGILTNHHHRNAEILDVNPEGLLDLLNQGWVPIVAGFQGVTGTGDVATIGRGGSDTTASLLGEALKAEKIEIYTDVNGIMTADPRICKKARTIDTMSYIEVYQLADSGAKVIHPRAVEIARRAGIPLIIKNTFSEEEGTEITDYKHLNHKLLQQGKMVTSIAHRMNRTQFIVEGALDNERFFDALANKDVSIDIINIFPDKRFFTVDSDQNEMVKAVLNEFEMEIKMIEKCCKVTVVGERMTGVPGVMAQIIRALSKCDVEILQTSDSLTTIACLVREVDLEKSVGALHKAFELE